MPDGIVTAHPTGTGQQLKDLKATIALVKHIKRLCLVFFTLMLGIMVLSVVYL
jgi:hypothetical protein